MDSILVATDLSARSAQALRRAMRLATDSGAQLTVAHVIDDDLPGPVILRRRAHLKAAARLKRRLPRIFAAALVMMAAVWAGGMLVANAAGPVFGTVDAPAAHFALRVIALAALIGAGGLAYTLCAFLFGAAQRSDLTLLRRRPKGALPAAD